ncbi:hypothetical protein llap_12810 [Limosa lapponica baueri]|uniref:Bridge-like lipid transfer protein family member 1 middle region domain-containing protein n=1 Tax=Limosa lapponica baueri TaxID=1758121 RepID=A0A2I0TSY5_LIMLA|nr:hypothetical protein llap_12810 [Limosa lapponica baueri]
MMVRSSHQLSKQISDLIRQPSTAPQPPKEDVATPLPSEKTPTSINQTPVETNEFPQLPEGLEKKPIVLKFSAMIDGIAIGAALLPSLKAEYKMGRMRSHGMTESSSAGTWTLNVLWKMCGIDVHMDPNIGKRLNALGNTLTTLTGEEDIDDIADLNSVNIADLSDEDEVDTMSPTIHADITNSSKYEE